MRTYFYINVDRFNPTTEEEDICANNFISYIISNIKTGYSGILEVLERETYFKIYSTRNKQQTIQIKVEIRSFIERYSWYCQQQGQKHLPRITFSIVEDEPVHQPPIRRKSVYRESTSTSIPTLIPSLNSISSHQQDPTPLQFTSPPRLTSPQNPHFINKESESHLIGTPKTSVLTPPGTPLTISVHSQTSREQSGRIAIEHLRVTPASINFIKKITLVFPGVTLNSFREDIATNTIEFTSSILAKLFIQKIKEFDFDLEPGVQLNDFKVTNQSDHFIIKIKNIINK